jgi:cysteine-S-conjugate beta-lyase
MGVIVTNEKYWLPVRRTVAEYGYCVSPDDCYLALRGFRTIGVRMERQMASALAVARWLQARDEVQRVLYPALPDDPGHAIWKRDFEGAASLFGVVLKPVSNDALERFVDGLQLFGIGSSWGGYESLITVARVEGNRSVTRWQPGGPTVRLHIGLEDPDDIKTDLAQAFDRMRGV